MLITVKVTQAELDDMKTTREDLSAAVLDQLDQGVTLNELHVELVGFDVEVTVD